MPHDPRGYLFDVREAADAISAFIASVDFDGYPASPLIHSAVERKFEIIGEALNLLSRSEPELARQIPDLERIVAFRNLLIHGYAAVNHARVWAIANEFLPVLRETVSEMLDKLER
jgi:uncharacterized protein with HEPN domain